MKYVYPALFKEESDGKYSVSFPDLKGCYTGGDCLEEAVEMAEDALCLWLYNAESCHTPIPEASSLNSVKCASGEVASLVACDTLEYKKFFGKQSVRKTVTLPAWLNTMAENADISFSSVLQHGLKQALNIAG